MRREDVSELLHEAVGKVGLKQRHFLQHGVGAAFHGEEERHFVGAELIDHQEGVFAVALGDIVDIAMHVFTRHRQMLKLCQNMTTDLRQHRRAIAADVKDLLAFFRREGIEARGEDRQLAGAAGGFKQAIRVGIVARRGVGVDVAHASDVIVVMGVAAIVLNIIVLDAVVVEAAEDLFRRGAEINPEVVHQPQLAVFVNLRK